ncbi:MAG: hypothetical protein VX019_02730 [Pseudomonadota bacterium]|nr:hypothetical protein [Pseudomonadota bacterium]
MLAIRFVNEKISAHRGARGPLYAEANIRADISHKSHDAAVKRLVDLLQAHGQQSGQ